MGWHVPNDGLTKHQRYYRRNKEKAKANRLRLKEYHKKYQKKYGKEYRRKNHEYYLNYFKENSSKILDSNQRRLSKIGNILHLSSKQFHNLIISWSLFVKKRDNNLCQICGKQGKESHHIFHKSKYPKLSLVKNNGITLCKKCHFEVHGKLNCFSKTILHNELKHRH